MGFVQQSHTEDHSHKLPCLPRVCETSPFSLPSPEARLVCHSLPPCCGGPWEAPVCSSVDAFVSLRVCNISAAICDEKKKKTQDFFKLCAYFIYKRGRFPSGPLQFVKGIELNHPETREHSVISKFCVNVYKVYYSVWRPIH